MRELRKINQEELNEVLKLHKLQLSHHIKREKYSKEKQNKNINAIKIYN